MPSRRREARGIFHVEMRRKGRMTMRRAKGMEATDGVSYVVDHLVRVKDNQWTYRYAVNWRGPDSARSPAGRNT